MARPLRRLSAAVLAASLRAGDAETPAPLALPWYEKLSVVSFPHYFTADVGSESILPMIKDSNAAFALVEFFAPWCPHCQHFAPEYERFALIVRKHNEGAAPDQRILVAAMDCVRFQSACEAWGVNGFPTMLWGRREDWLHRNTGALREVEMTQPTAEDVAYWLSSHAHIAVNTALVTRQDLGQAIAQRSNGHLDGTVGLPTGGQPMALAAPAEKVDHWDIQVSTAMLLHAALGDAPSPARRNALLGFVLLLAERFPEEHVAHGGGTPCRASLLDLHSRLDDGGAAGLMGNPDGAEKKWRLCGTDWSEYGDRGWRSCKGTFAGKRGFTCGLWSLFHAIAARGEDASAGQDLHTMRSTVSAFFDCTECRKHFEGIPVTDADTASKSSVQLWWWRTHNEVNERVRRFEESFHDGDPVYPKVQWPTPTQCPGCQVRSSSFLSHRASQLITKDPATTPAWNTVEVTAFLTRFYGGA